MATIISLSHATAPAVLPPLQLAKHNPVVCRLPLLQHRIPAGFPSPADDYIENGLDLNTYLVRNKTRACKTGGGSQKSSLQVVEI